MNDALVFFTMHVVRACGEYYKDKPGHDQEQWGREVIEYLNAQKKILRHYEKAESQSYTDEELEQELKKYLTEDTDLSDKVLQAVRRNNESKNQRRTT